MKTSLEKTCLRLPQAVAVVALAIMFWAGTAVSGQSMPSQGQSLPSQGTPSQNQGMPSQDNGTRNWQIANMDRFLDSHPEISEQLQKDPSLIGNDQFISSHPALQQFLQQHPGIREEFTENPNAFMAREQRFEGGERGTLRVELSNMDQFLDSHPVVAEQLRKNPSLVDNRDFLQSHPDLQQFLQQHPGVSQEFKENPNAFMGQERGFERREEAGENGHFGDRDITRAELSNMDQFLDNHPEIAEQLRKNPALVNNRDFVQSHSDLQQFLQQHPGVSQEFKENPNAFMGRERGFEGREEAGENRGFGDRDTNRTELANMDQFLDSHQEIAEQVRKNPSLVNNHQFVQNHPQLQQFLQQHPGVSQEIKENPNAFMAQEQRFDQRENAQFLGSHSALAQELLKDPSLINNKVWLQKHPEVQEYLKTHPGAQQQLAANPQAAMNSLPQAGTGTAATKPTQIKPKP